MFLTFRRPAAPIFRISEIRLSSTNKNDIVTVEKNMYSSSDSRAEVSMRRLAEGAGAADETGFTLPVYK